MAGPFPTPSFRVPPGFSDEALQERLKLFTDQGNRIAGQGPSPAALGMADKIARDYIDRPLTNALKVSTALAPGPVGPVARSIIDVATSGGQPPVEDRQQKAVDLRSNILSAPGSIGGALARTLMPPVVTIFSEGSPLVEANRLSPEEAQADADQRVSDAKAKEKAIAAVSEARQKLRAMTDEEAAQMGLPVAPGGVDPQTDSEQAERRAQFDAQRLKEAQESTAEAEDVAAHPEKQATLPWWLSSAREALRGMERIPTGAAKAVAIANEARYGFSGGRSDLRAWIDTVDATFDKLLPPDKARAKDFVTQLSAGGGSMAGFLTFGALGGLAGVTQTMATTILGAAVQASSGFEDAEAHNATAFQKYIGLLADSAIGATEAFPIDRMLLRANQATGGAVSRWLSNTVATSIEEFLQEFGQNVGHDALAQRTYDENRDIDWSGAFQSGLIGGITGGMAGAAISALAETGVIQRVEPATQTEDKEPTTQPDDTAAQEDFLKRFFARSQAVIDQMKQQADFDDRVTTPPPDAAEPVPAEVGERVPTTETAEPEAIAERLRALPARPVTQVATDFAEALERPELFEPSGVSGIGGTMPRTTSDGNIVLRHAAPAIREELDPDMMGTGPIVGKERARLVGPDAVGRVYYGVESGPDLQQPAVSLEDFTKISPEELKAAKSLGVNKRRLELALSERWWRLYDEGSGYLGEGISPYVHEVEVGVDDLYNMNEDPLNLRAQLPDNLSSPERHTIYERLVKEAGFRGGYYQHGRVGLGRTAILFTKEKPTRVVDTRYGLPVSEIATPEDFRAPTPETFRKGGWAVITGTREADGPYTSDKNVAANNKLRDRLTKDGVRFEEVSGAYQGTPQGTSFLIFAPESYALRQGKAFGQESILTRDGLVYSDGSDRLVPARGVVIGDEALNSDFYSTLPGGTSFSVDLDFDAEGDRSEVLRAMTVPGAPDEAKLFSVIDAADRALSGSAADAITAFIAHPVDTTYDTGVMDARPLERALRANDAVAKELARAVEPVKEELRRQFGDFITLYRVQREVEAREEGVTRVGFDEGERAALSWSSDPSFANYYAGVRPTKPLFTEKEIVAAEKEHAEKGEVKIPGGHTLRGLNHFTGLDGKPQTSIDLYSGDEFVTDTDSVRAYMEDLNRWRTEDAETMRKRGEAIVRAQISVDDIIWVSDRAGQSEFIVNNLPGSGTRIDGKGRLVQVQHRTTTTPEQAIEQVDLSPDDLKPLPGLKTGKPVESVVRAARAYAESVGLPVRRQSEYVKVDVERAKRIAEAYENMKDDPTDPKVAAAYDAMIDETLAQYQFVKATGLKVEAIEEGQADPYPEGPKQVLEDLERGHLWFFPTDQGFGSLTEAQKANPLLRPTEEKLGTRTLVANDIFRIVHDFFGHGIEGSGFGARGEENAWQSHMRLYSQKALPAVTSETRGQNSWVNYGPYGEQNRSNQRETVYADQKAGIMPSWTWTEGVAEDMKLPGAPPRRDLYAAQQTGGGTASARGPLRGEQRRPRRGIAGGTDAAADEVSLTKIAQNVIDLMNLTARQGRFTLKGSNVVGQYSARQNVVRMKTWNDLSTLVHEGAHALEQAASPALRQWIDGNKAGLEKVAKALYGGGVSKMPPKEVVSEGFAEFFRVYTLNRGFTTIKYPTLTQDFTDLLERTDPQLKAGLDAIGDQFAAWLQLPSAQLVRNMVVSGQQTTGINAAVQELQEKGFGNWYHDVVTKTVKETTNRFARLNELVAEVLNLGQANLGQALDLKRAEDPRVLIRLAANAGNRAMVQATDGVMPYKSVAPATQGLRAALMRYHGLGEDGHLKAIDPVRQKDFAAYLVALRGIDEYRRLAEGKIERPPLAATLGDLRLTVKEMNDRYGEDFSEAAKIVHEYGMALWQKAYDAGLMTKQTYRDGLDRQFYVPLQRDMSDKDVSTSDIAEAMATGKGRSVVKRFRGSDRDIIDPMDALMQKTFSLERVIVENDIKLALARLADKAGKAGALVERVPAHRLLGQEYSVQEIARQLTKDDTVSEADAQDLMTILEASIEEGNRIALFRSQQAVAGGDNVLFFWEQGKLAAIQLKDGDVGADIINTMNSLGRENMPVFLNTIAATSTAFRNAITLWPDFLLVNFIRDQASAFILTDVGYKPFVTGLRGVGDEVRQNEWARQYNAAMGVMGGMNTAALHKARVERDLDALRGKGYRVRAFSEKGVLGKIKGFGRVVELTETGSRLGIFRSAYNRAKKDGLTDWEASIEASYIATDYIDFGLNGNRMLMWRRLVPFLNAQLQGLYKMGRTLGGDEVRQRKGLNFALRAYFKDINKLDLSRTEKQALQTGRKAWLKMMSLGFIGAALALAFRDDPDYQDASEYLRATGWVIPIGDGRIFYIPKPFELAVFSNFVERGIEFASGDGNALDHFMRGVAMNLTPPVAPPAIQNVVEQIANYDFFTGREIVPDYRRALAPELQYDNYTSDFAKTVGEAFGWSPLRVDHFMTGMGASAYRDLTWAYNSVLGEDRPSSDVTNWPVTRRFVRDARRGAQSAADFWAYASTVNGTLRSAEVSYKNLVEAGQTRAASEFLDTLDPDARAYALLGTHFKADAKRLNPFYRARQIGTIVSAMRRELSSPLGVEDTQTKFSEPVKLSADEKYKIDQLLSEYMRREMRNTLIYMQDPGWRNKTPLPTDTTLDLLDKTNMFAFDELNRRIRKANIYSAETVQEYWPEARDRLLSDREDAFLKDLTTIAKVMR